MRKTTDLNELMFAGLSTGSESKEGTRLRNHHESVPRPKLPEGFSDSMSYLRHLVKEGTLKRFGNNLSVEVTARIVCELDVIEKHGWEDYFLFIWDALNSARNNLLMCIPGPGSGSAACSMVNYVIGITQIDPLKFHLPFERFANEVRNQFPDMVIEVDDDSIREFCAMMKGKYDNKMVPLAISRTDRDGKAYEEVSYHLWAIASSDMHTIMPMREVMDIASNSHILCPSGCISDISDKGVKVQVVSGCRELSVISRILDEPDLCISNTVKLDFLNSIPMDDEKTLEVFRKGNSDGIFLFDAPGVREHLKNIKPDNFLELAAINAMYRPGIVGQLPEYTKRKLAKKPIEYVIPEMAEVLDETYGLLIYQEQIIQLAKIIGNLSAKNADAMRLAINRRDGSEMQERFLPLFIEGGRGNGYSQKLLEQMFNSWWEYGAYTFLKSHTLCKTLICYQMAYLKVHYPEAYERVTKDYLK